MLITYFIGNGFDLNNEMHTKFTDFYDHIKKTISPEELKNNDIYSNIEKDKDNWSYFEYQLGKLTLDYNQETKAKLLDDIEEFRDDFIDYMVDQNQQFSLDKNKAKEIFVNSLVKYPSQLSVTERTDLGSLYNSYPSNRIFNFINFNYTDTLEQVANLFEKNNLNVNSLVKNNYLTNHIGKIIPIHKQLNNGMFLGVNDETQINSKIFNEIERNSLIKPFSNDGFRDNTNKEVEDLITQSNIVIIYGMSLGETDKKWWEILSKWLEKNPNNRMIFYVHDKDFSRKSVRKYLEKRKEYEDRFIGFSYDLSDINDKDIQDKINALREKIYLIPNSVSDFKFLKSDQSS